MFRVSVTYPRLETGKFDLAYYCEIHMPMVKNVLGDSCKGVEIEVPVNNEQPYYVVAHLLFDSEDVFRQSYFPHAEQVRADIENYTNLKPVVQMGTLTYV